MIVSMFITKIIPYKKTIRVYLIELGLIELLYLEYSF